MRERRLYWRRKAGSVVLEGRLDNGKAILITTLPEANRFIKLINENASLFTQEKLKEINEKVMRLALRPDRIRKRRQELPLIKIRRTPNNDAKEPTEEEILKSLQETNGQES